MDTLNRIQAIEKVYLHTDKPYYFVGDTIWFKAYVTSGGSNLPSNRSGTLYVDLIDEADSLIQTKKLAITNGSANAEFVLDDSTTLEGNYRIRAYTQLMRNAGPDYFYDRTFTIGNAPSNTVFSNICYRRIRRWRCTFTFLIPGQSASIGGTALSTSGFPPWRIRRSCRAAWFICGPMTRIISSR